MDAEPFGNRPWWLLAAMSGIMGLVVFDETVVGVALATIGRDFGATSTAAHWIVNAYLLTFAVFVALGGRLGDTVGRRPVLMTGLVLFGGASLMAGFAETAGWLIAWRAVEGAGAALVFPASFAIMTRAFAPERRGLALGIQTMTGGIFMASGPWVGGLMVEYVSWRWIFWINVPLVMAIAGIALASWMPVLDDGRRERDTARTDWAGLLTLVAGLSCLVGALMQATDWGFLAPGTLLLGALGVTFLVVFVVVERRVQEPLIDLDLLRIPTFTAGDLVFFAFQFDKVVIFVFLALYLQDDAGRSATGAGLILLMAVAPTLLTSLAAGRFADRFGSRRPLLLALTFHGSALTAVAVATAAGHDGLLIGALIVWGASMPVVAVPARRALMGAVPKDRHGVASGLNLTIQMTGGVIGVAVASALLHATGSYWTAFAATAGVMWLAFAVTWLWLEHTPRG